MSFIDDVMSVLKTPIPLPEFLTRPIPIPSISDYTVSQKNNRAKTKLTSREEYQLEGVLHGGNNTPFAIGGYDLNLTSDTWIFGNLSIGTRVRAKCQENFKGDKICVSIVVV